MPTIQKLRNRQILLRGRQNALRKELIHLVDCSEVVPDNDRTSLLENIDVKIAELAEIDCQIRDITETIQLRNQKNRLAVESSQKSGGESKSKKKKIAKMHALNGKNGPISAFTGVVQGGSVGGGKKR